MKGNTKMERNMEEAFSHGQMNPSMMESSKKERWREKGSRDGRTIQSTMETGRTTRWKGRASTRRTMGLCMRESG